MCRIKIRIAVLVAVSVMSLGCKPQSQAAVEQEINQIRKESAHMRTQVPLIRAIDVNDEAPLELEFDVQALQGDDTPPLFFGVRVAGSDPTTAAALARSLRTSAVSSYVHLSRLTESGLEPVTLMRSEDVSRSEVRTVSLPADGHAPELMAFTADVTTMQAAGLEESGVAYKELAFAYVPELPVGRYRLEIAGIGNREALVAGNAQWVVAYTAKAK